MSSSCARRARPHAPCASDLGQLVGRSSAQLYAVRWGWGQRTFWPSPRAIFFSLAIGLMTTSADHGHIAVVKRLLVGEQPARRSAPREARQRLVFIDQSDNGLLITRILILRDMACAMGGK